MNIPGYDRWKLAGPHDNDREYFIICTGELATGEECGEEIDIAYGAVCEYCNQEYDEPEPPEQEYEND